jgi:hypothetical protein
MTGRIDQIVYRDPGLGSLSLLRREGIGPVAASMDQDALKTWDRTLFTHISTDSGYGYPSLCFLVVGNRSALLYRTTSANRSSTLAHVLTGDLQDLSAEMALGSWRWRWPGALDLRGPLSAELPPVDAAAFLNTAHGDWWTLVSTAREALGLNQLITGMLSRPGPEDLPTRKFAIITPEAEPGNLRVRLLAGLCSRLGGGFLTGGFSTHEPSYDDGQSYLPRFILASSRQVVESFAITRQEIDLCTEGRPAEEADRAADILTTAYQADPLGDNLARLLAGQDARRVEPQDVRWLQEAGFIPPASSRVTEPARLDESLPPESEREPERVIAQQFPLADSREWRSEAAQAVAADQELGRPFGELDESVRQITAPTVSPAAPVTAPGSAAPDQVRAAAGDLAAFSVLHLVRQVISAGVPGLVMVPEEIRNRIPWSGGREAVRDYLTRSPVDVLWVAEPADAGRYALEADIVDALVDAIYSGPSGISAGTGGGLANPQVAERLRALATMPDGVAPRGTVRRVPDSERVVAAPPGGPGSHMAAQARPPAETLRLGRLAAVVAIAVLVLMALLFAGGLS